MAIDVKDVEAFWQNGFIVIDDALDDGQLTDLKHGFASWVELSREHAGNFGETIDSRERFSVEPGHTADRPALRRIASPTELSERYLDAMRNNAALDAITDLIGPNIRFSNSKVNSKLPGTATAVKYHQDFLFELHSNDDLITALIFLDDVTEQNGPLEVVPGSHRGPLHDLWHDGVFTGAVDDETECWASSASTRCVGRAGTACLMHTRLLHGSAPNHSNAPRTLFICSYAAEDAAPLHGNHIPSIHAGEIVRGVATGRVRSTAFDTLIPEMPKGASFFEQQAKTD